MSRYAEKTKVPVSRSRDEIEKTLARYGADKFLYGSETGRAMIGFQMNNRHIKIMLPLPGGESPKDQQETRRRWRSLTMIIKAKLEAVASGISVFDDEFMAHIVLPDGGTVGQFMRPQIESAYKTGNMPNLLPAPDDQQ